jgi:hypothetical protein
MIASQDYVRLEGFFHDLIGSYYQLLCRSWRNIVNTKIKKFSEFLSLDSLELLAALLILCGFPSGLITDNR